MNSERQRGRSWAAVSGMRIRAVNLVKAGKQPLAYYRLICSLRRSVEAIARRKGDR